MIAAGHPALYFDMYRYQLQMPAHWGADAEALATTPARQLPTSIEALRNRVLLAAVRLFQERRDQSPHAPQPEFSEYDCAACHLGLQANSPRLRRGSTGTPLWQPWYTAGQAAVTARGDLRLDQPQLAESLNALETSATERSQPPLDGVASDPAELMRAVLSGPLPDCEADYCEAATWLDKVESLGRAGGLPEIGSRRERFNELILSFRKNVLGQAPASAGALHILMPREWARSDIESLRKELTLCIAPDDSRGEQ
jgi:hypothetical protein